MAERYLRLYDKVLARSGRPRMRDSLRKASAAPENGVLKRSRSRTSPRARGPTTVVVGPPCGEGVSS